jgi:hypothetical protein
MGADDPTLPSLQAALPNVKDIDRSSMNAWEDAMFFGGSESHRPQEVGDGRDRDLGVPSLAYPVVDAYEVSFIEDAVTDNYTELHETAVLRLAHAGAAPNTTIAMIAEWFRDWKSPSQTLSSLRTSKKCRP